MADLVNLTPHDIVVCNEAGEEMFRVKPSGTVARVQSVKERIDTLHMAGMEFAINRSRFGDVIGLPAPEYGVFYIVSGLVAQAVPSRSDLLIVDDTVRDKEGRIIGCRAFARV